MSEIQQRPVDPSDAYEDAEDPSVGPTWVPQDLHGVNWALRRLAALTREKLENEEIIKIEILKLEAQLEKLNGAVDRGIKFFESRIRAFAEAQKEQLLGGGKAKSRKLPGGTIGWRKVPEKLAVKDEEALLDWARQQPVEAELLRIREEPALDELKRHFKKTGEVPPGTEVEPEHEEFSIRLEAGNGSSTEH